MKHLLLLVLMSFGFMFSNAQSNEIFVNPLIFEFYPETKVEIMLKENLEEIIFWNAIYDFGYEIKSISKSEKELVKNYQEVEIKDFNKINILGMNLFPMKGKNQSFKIKDTNKLLTLFSEEIIRKRLTENQNYKK